MSNVPRTGTISHVISRLGDNRFVVRQHDVDLTDVIDLNPLWRNLAIAGGLCATYTTGWDQRADLACVESGYITEECRAFRRWYPGCGRSAR